MRVVDKPVLARLREGGLDVYEGLVIARKDPAKPVVANLPLPYINYASAIGDDDNRRLAGRRMRRSVPFWLYIAGLTEEQVKGAGERARELLERWIPDVEGHRAWGCALEESQRVRRDDDAVRPDGKPLFYGNDGYAVSIMLAPTPVI